MQDLPRVSIGMPTYNGEDTIQESVESILNQTYENIHLFISVNKSNDKTFTKLSHLYGNHPKISLIKNQEFLDAHQNFFKVLSMSQDDFFMWASDDDYWDPKFIQHGMNALTDGRDYFFPNFVTCDMSNKKAGKSSNDRFRFLENDDASTRMLNFINLHHLSHKCNIVYSLFRTEFLRQQWAKQDISDDGALGALISFYGKASVSDSVLFYKSFSNDRTIIRVFKEMMIGLLPSRKAEFKLQLRDSYKKISESFPEYTQTIEEIVEKYPRYRFKKDFKILKKVIIE